MELAGGGVPFPLCSHSCLGWSSVPEARPLYPAFLPGTVPSASFQKGPWVRFCPESCFLETGSSASKTEQKQCDELAGRVIGEHPPINDPLLTPGWGVPSGASWDTALQQPGPVHRLDLTLGTQFPSWHFSFPLRSPVPRRLLVSFQSLKDDHVCHRHDCSSQVTPPWSNPSASARSQAFLLHTCSPLHTNGAGGRGPSV